MTDVERLVTLVEIDEDAPDPSRMSVAARLEAVLTDGRRVLLLDDRGWSSSGPPDLCERVTVEDLASTARAVVGPDEPRAGRSHAEAAADHWGALAGELGCHGVVVGAARLAGLPHEVVLGERLRARLVRR